MRRHEVPGDVAEALRGLPKLVPLKREGDAIAADLADEPLDLRVLLGVPPVVLERDRIARLVGAKSGVHVGDEFGVGELRLAKCHVRHFHLRSLPRTLSRATMPSCCRYCTTSRRPNFEAPSSRSRKVYGTSTIFFVFARAITSNPILKPIAFRCTPSRAVRRTAKKPLVASLTGTRTLPMRQATRETIRRRSGQSWTAPPLT